MVDTRSIKHNIYTPKHKKNQVISLLLKKHHVLIVQSSKIFSTLNWLYRSAILHDCQTLKTLKRSKDFKLFQERGATRDGRVEALNMALFREERSRAIS